jgi:hypothetical protein
MRETFTSGSVGRAPGNRCLYPEGGHDAETCLVLTATFTFLTQEIL